MYAFTDLLLVAVPVAGIAWTVAQEEIFKELREWCKSHSDHPNLVVRKMCYLPTCYYCFSHWVTFGFVALFQVKVLADDWRGYVAAAFALAAVAVVYLSLFNVLRAWLRGVKAWADLTEAQVKIAKIESQVNPMRLVENQ